MEATKVFMELETACELGKISILEEYRLRLEEQDCEILEDAEFLL